MRWDEVAEGATAAMAGMGGRGAPDLPHWVPEQLEWVVLSSVGGAPGIIWPLPPGSARDELVEVLRTRFGPRWYGTGLPLQEARQRMGIVSGTWSGLKVFGIVVGVLALLVLSLVLIGLLLRPVVFVPIGWGSGDGSSSADGRAAAAARSLRTCRAMEVRTRGPGWCAWKERPWPPCRFAPR